MSEFFSTKEQLEDIAQILTGYLKLPFSGDSIPGALMENVIACVRSGEVLNTYDFVDIINKSEKFGWQVKSTKSNTPVTWKRAKIPNSLELIKKSKSSSTGLQNLGNAIIDYCNDHAIESINQYELEKIGYARLVVHKTGKITYFEKELCSRESPDIFNKKDFSWKWSTPKKTIKKEQLPALHGTYKPTSDKWFAWHGLGENQLHFSGERAWWPSTNHKIDFPFPGERLSQEQLMELLTKISSI